MDDLLDSAETAAAKSLSPGLTLFRHYLDDAAQRALAAEITELVLQAPWFLPRMPRSGRAFSVRMTNCGRLGCLSDRDGGYRYQATHPLTARAHGAAPGPRRGRVCRARDLGLAGRQLLFPLWWLAA